MEFSSAHHGWKYVGGKMWPCVAALDKPAKNIYLYIVTNITCRCFPIIAFTNSPLFKLTQCRCHRQWSSSPGSPSRSVQLLEMIGKYSLFLAPLGFLPKTTTDPRIFKKWPQKKEIKQNSPHSFHYTCNCHHIWCGPLSLTPGLLTNSSLSALITFLTLNLFKYFILRFPIAVAVLLFNLITSEYLAFPHTVCISRLVLHHCLVPSFTKRHSPVLSSLAQV